MAGSVSIGSLVYDVELENNPQGKLQAQLASLEKSLKVGLTASVKLDGDKTKLQGELTKLEKSLKLGIKADVSIAGAQAAAQGLASTRAAADPARIAIQALGHEVATLRNRFISLPGDATRQEIDGVTRAMTDAKRRADQMAQGLAVGSRELRQLSQVSATAERTIRGANGEMSRLGIASQISLGVVNAASRLGIGSLTDLGSTAFGLASKFQGTINVARIFAQVLQTNNQDVDEAQGLVNRLAERFGILPSVVQDATVELVRNGATLKQTETLLVGAGASALRAQRSAAEGFAAIANTLVTGTSTYLNYIGVSENVDQAMNALSKTLNKSVKDFTDQERATAITNLIIKATGGEVKLLDTLLGGLTGATGRTETEFGKLGQTIGERVLPTVQGLTVEAGKAARSLNDVLKGSTSLPVPLTAAAGAVTALTVSLSVGGLAGALGSIPALAAGASRAIAVAFGPAGLAFISVSALAGAVAGLTADIRKLEDDLLERQRDAGKLLSASPASNILADKVLVVGAELKRLRDQKAILLGQLATVSPDDKAGLEYGRSILAGLDRQIVQQTRLLSGYSQELTALKARNTAASADLTPKGDPAVPVEKLGDAVVKLLPRARELVIALNQAKGAEAIARSDAAIRAFTKDNDDAAQAVAAVNRELADDKRSDKQLVTATNRTQEFTDRLRDMSNAYRDSVSDGKVSTDQALAFGRSLNKLERDAAQAGVALPKALLETARALDRQGTALARNVDNQRVAAEFARVDFTRSLEKLNGEQLRNIIITNDQAAATARVKGDLDAYQQATDRSRQAQEALGRVIDLNRPKFANVGFDPSAQDSGLGGTGSAAIVKALQVKALLDANSASAGNLRSAISTIDRAFEFADAGAIKLDASTRRLLESFRATFTGALENGLDAGAKALTAYETKTDSTVASLQAMGDEQLKSTAATANLERNQRLLTAIYVEVARRADVAADAIKRAGEAAVQAANDEALERRAGLLFDLQDAILGAAQDAGAGFYEMAARGLIEGDRDALADALEGAFSPATLAGVLSQATALGGEIGTRIADAARQVFARRAGGLDLAATVSTSGTETLVGANDPILIAAGRLGTLQVAFEAGELAGLALADAIAEIDQIGTIPDLAEDARELATNLRLSYDAAGELLERQSRIGTLGSPTGPTDGARQDRSFEVVGLQILDPASLSELDAGLTQIEQRLKDPAYQEFNEYLLEAQQRLVTVRPAFLSTTDSATLLGYAIKDLGLAPIDFAPGLEEARAQFELSTITTEQFTAELEFSILQLELFGDGTARTQTRIADLRKELAGLRDGTDSATLLGASLKALDFSPIDFTAVLEDVRAEFALSAITAEQFAAELEFSIAQLELFGDGSVRTRAKLAELRKELAGLRGESDSGTLLGRTLATSLDLSPIDFTQPLAGFKAALDAGVISVADYAAELEFSIVQLELFGDGSLEARTRVAVLKRELASLSDPLNDVFRIAGATTGALRTLGVSGSDSLASLVSGAEGVVKALKQGDTIGAILAIGTTLVSVLADALDPGRKLREELEGVRKELSLISAEATIASKTVPLVFGGFGGIAVSTFDLPAVDRELVGLATSIESAVFSGVEAGFNAAIESGNIEDFGKTFEKSLGQFVVKGLIEGFVKGEVIKGILQPALEQYFEARKTPEIEDDLIAIANLKSAAGIAAKEGEDFYKKILRPVADAFGLGPEPKPASAATLPTGPSFSLPPSVQIAVFEPAIRGFEAFGGHVGSFGVHVDRLGGYVNRLVTDGIRVTVATSGGSTTAAYR